MKAWLFQDPRQKGKLADKCPWSVGWLDPDGKRKSKRIGSKSAAEKYARRIEGQLASGTYHDESRKTWAQLIEKYEADVLVLKRPGTQQTVRQALNHFTRIIKPVKVRGITAQTIDSYIKARRAEPAFRPRKSKGDEQTGAMPKRSVSPATINCELRSVRAVLRKAARWKWIPSAPAIEFIKEPGKLPVYVTPEHFASIYGACKDARWPEAQPFTPADWWRGLLVTAYMTGWRIGSLMALRWQDTDLDAATAVSRAADNKGNRDQLVPLHPLVVQHLRRLKSFSPFVFPWFHGQRALFTEFAALQKAAGVRLSGRRDHYGFHDLRRAFATMNASNLTPDALQALMQHKDYQTTQRYINLARQLNPAVAALYVPALPESAAVAAVGR